MPLTQTFSGDGLISWRRSLSVRKTFSAWRRMRSMKTNEFGSPAGEIFYRTEGCLRARSKLLKTVCETCPLPLWSYIVFFIARFPIVMTSSSICPSPSTVHEVLRQSKAKRGVSRQFQGLAVRYLFCFYMSL